MPSDSTSRTKFDAVENTIVDFIRREFVGFDVPLAPDTDLLGDGMLDSLGVLRLATFVDEEYRLEMQPADFVIENFITVSALAAYIHRTRKPPRGSDG